MGHAFFRIDDDPNEQELNFFNMDLQQEDDVIFYSQNMISDTEQEMQDDY